MTKEGLTYDQIKEALKSIPEVPAFNDLKFVENSWLPENTLVISSNLMKILKDLFNTNKEEQLPE